MGAEVQRNWRGQPLIIPPGGGKPVPYDRASSYGNVLEDTYHLSKWQQRMVAKGLALRPELALAAATTPLEDKRRLNEIAEAAIEAAGGSRASTTGTSLHTLTELIDLDEPLPPVPPEYEADLAAYRQATDRFEMVHVEPFMVCDELRVAGTPDRLMVDRRVPPVTEQQDGLYPELVFPPLLVGDLKTGSNGGFLHQHVTQLAIYAHSVLYDPATGTRTPVELDQDVAWIFHMPAGQGTCDLHQLDIVAGWDGVRLAHTVRAWRKRAKKLSTPIGSNQEKAA